jgi:hypothetical protein
MRQVSERIVSDVKVFYLEIFHVQIVEGVRVDKTVERIVVQNYGCQVG